MVISVCRKILLTLLCNRT